MVTEKTVEAVLEARVRPVLRAHGGEVCLVGYRGGMVAIGLLGRM